MANILDLARRAAQERGERPPGGEQPGTPEYDRWVQEWFSAGVDAGDPDLVRRIGGGAGAGYGAGQAEEGEGGIAPWQDAAPSSEWIGKRTPTPRELRRYAHEQGWSEDFQRFDDRQLADWLRRGQWDVQGGRFAGGVEKPTETGGVLAPRGRGGYGGGDGYRTADGGGGGYLTQQGPGGPGTYGGAPAFSYGEFKPPSYEEALADPGYQAALREGAGQLQASAAAGGVLRTGGTLKDLIKYGQGMAARQYGDVYNRAAQTYATNLGLAKDIFAPQYGSWQTQYAGDLSRWQTKYGGDLQKYLQREGNIYGLLNPSMPSY